MDLTWMLGQVPHAVQAAFAGFHGHLRNALIDAAKAMLLEGSCLLSRMAWVASSSAKVPRAGSGVSSGW